MTLTGKVAFLTGASLGLGKAVACAYVRAGIQVAMAARDPATLEAAAVEARKAGPGRVLVLPCDVTDEVAIASALATTVGTFGGLDILVNNAGVHGPKGPIEAIDLAEWRRALEVNLMGAVISVHLAVPYLKARGRGKIINLSGGGATKPMPFMTAYAASKAAVVRFTESVAVQLQEDRIDVNAVAPGALNTRLLDDVLDAGPERVGEAAYRSALKQKADGGGSMDLAASLFLFLASAESDGITGRLISAAWDDWQLFPERKAEIKDTDIYTLRRVLAKDRGRNWDR